MTFDEEKSEILIQCLHKLVGLKVQDMREYARENNIMHVLDHPTVLPINQKQYDKIYLLKDFINAYHYLRRAEAEKQIQIQDVEKAKRFFVGCLAQYREKEIALAAFFDNSNHLIACHKVAEGGVNSAFIDSRMIIKKAIQMDACGIILAHNHPSTKIIPSLEDINLTEKFFIQTRLMNINFLDHIIVGGECAYSFVENGYMTKWMEEMQEKGAGWSGNGIIAKNDEVAEAFEWEEEA